MTIAKYLHSCLLLTLDGKRLLFDPGSFSFADGSVAVEDLPRVDYLVITHDHPDHHDPDALRAIVDRDRPELVTNGELAATLRDRGYTVTEHEAGERTFGPFRLEAVNVPHEPILSDRVPRLTAYCVNGTVLNPGDSFAETLLRFRGVPLLCLPIMAPFLTERRAYDFAVRMAPGAVLPVHDGYAKEYFARARQEAFRDWLGREGIDFHGLLAAGEGLSLENK